MNNLKEYKCGRCEKAFSDEAIGTKNRNHCPFCLWSKHVDEEIGDRASKCGGLMRPICFAEKKDGEIMVIHECLSCGKISKNRIAGDDSEEKIIEIFEESLLNKEEVEKKSGYKLFEDKDKFEKRMFGG